MTSRRYRCAVHGPAPIDPFSLLSACLVVSGALVLWIKSPVPDLVIGLVVAAIAFRGGREILEIAEEASEPSSSSKKN